MTTRDIQGHLQEIYGIDVSPSLISQVTDAISEEVILWQNRPLDEVYPIVYLDAVRIKVRHDSRVINKAVYLAIGNSARKSPMISRQSIKPRLWNWRRRTLKYLPLNGMPVTRQ